MLCPFPWCEDELQLELSKIFTRLKIVGKKKERARLTEDIVHMTDTFKSHEECEKPRVVLIEGQPGMGKTTYCQKLAYDWSVEDISPEASFPKVEMLLVLKCRDMKTANIEEIIDDQLLPLDVGKREKENFFHFICCNQSKILLILDGLDEMSDDLLKCMLLLIQGKVFPYTHLLLTARHEAGLKVRRYCDTLLEIVGYTNVDADCYIKKYFKSHEDPRLAIKLLKKLDRNRQLRELTSNPLNTALLCLVCEDTRGIFPSNRTKLYDELVSCVLRRYFAKTGGSVDDNDPIKACETQLNQLGKMALKALLKDQLAFSAEELTGHSTEFLEFGFLSREAGASKIRPKPNYAFTHKTFQEYFAAFHLSHELLTGDRDKAGLLSQLSPVDKFWQVWEFLFSMVASTSDHVDDDAASLLVSRLCASFHHKRAELSLSSAEDYDIDDNSSDDYLYDSDGWNYDDYEDFDDYYNYDDYNDSDDYDYDNDYDVEDEVYDYDEDDYDSYDSCEEDTRVPICEDSSYDWDNDQVEPKGTLMELTFLTKTLSLICDCEQGETQLSDNQKKMAASLAHCFPVYQLKVDGASRYAAVLSEYLKANNNLTELVWCDELDELALATIEHVLRPGHNLVHLRLRGELRSTSLTPALQENRTLTHLNLSGASIGIPGAKALRNVLQSNCTLTHLSLPSNKIGHIGAEALAKGLQSNEVLVHLNIRFNWIGDQGVLALSQALKFNQTLTYLDVAEFPFLPFSESDFDDLDGIMGDSGITAIAHSLRSNCSLTYLDLRGNNSSDSALAVLGESLQSNCTLTHLYVGSFGLVKTILTDFGNSAAAAFAKALQSRCTQLTRLDLHNSSVSSSSATILAEALHSNNTLALLDLRWNKITFSGAEALAKALNVNRTLTHLDLAHNHIGDSGAKEFLETLKSNKSLVFLNLRHNFISKSGKQMFQHINSPTGCKLEWW